MDAKSICNYLLETEHPYTWWFANNRLTSFIKSSSIKICYLNLFDIYYIYIPALPYCDSHNTTKVTG